MCFNIHSEHPRRKIAKKDIVCYKRLNQTCIRQERKIILTPPCYTYFKYVANKLYTTGLGIDQEGREINEGFHSYFTLGMAREDVSWEEYVYRCIIPKGACYFYNPDDKEYVSNQIIIKRKA